MCLWNWHWRCCCQYQSQNDRVDHCIGSFPVDGRCFFARNGTCMRHHISRLECQAAAYRGPRFQSDKIHWLLTLLHVHLYRKTPTITNLHRCMPRHGHILQGRYQYLFFVMGFALKVKKIVSENVKYMTPKHRRRVRMCVFLNTMYIPNGRVVGIERWVKGIESYACSQYLALQRALSHVRILEDAAL